MPGIRDDIIIKWNVLEGLFKAAAHESEQVEKHGLLYECSDLDNDLRTAYIPFRDCLQSVVDEMEARVTKKVVNGRKRNNHK